MCIRDSLHVVELGIGPILGGLAGAAEEHVLPIHLAVGAPLALAPRPIDLRVGLQSPEDLAGIGGVGQLDAAGDLHDAAVGGRGVGVGIGVVGSAVLVGEVLGSLHRRRIV